MYKVAIVGAGLIATLKHFPAWRKVRRDAVIVAICDSDLRRGESVRARYGIPRSYGDVQSMLEEQRPDIVDICTPPATHANVAIRALNMGAHVLIEKPMAITVEECDAIRAAGDSAGRIICVAHSDLFYPVFKKARRVVQEGGVGAFRGMRILLSTPTGYITSVADHWAHRLPGGVIGESGPHAVYLTSAFIGPVKSVHVEAVKVAKEYPWSPFEDYRIEIVGDAAISSVVLAYGTAHWAAKLELWGTDGFLTADLESQTLVRYGRPGLAPRQVGVSALSEAVQLVGSLAVASVKVLARRMPTAHDVLIREFSQSLRSGSVPPVTAEEGREAVRIMALISECLQPSCV